MLLLRNTSLEAEAPWELGWRSIGCKALLEVPGGGLLVKFAVRLLSKEEISPIRIRSSRTTRDLSHLGDRVSYSDCRRGTRHRLSVAVRGRPPSGSWSGVLFTGIRDCTLKCVGVPVKFPVKGWIASEIFTSMNARQKKVERFRLQVKAVE